MEYMDQDCSSCHFVKRNITKEPCNSCVGWSAGNGSNWQPRKPRRKDLVNDLTIAREKLREAEEQLAEATAERDKWVEWHQNRDDELRVANEEMKSMHNELAAKQAIIETQERELAEVKAKIEAQRVYMAIYGLRFL